MIAVRWPCQMLPPGEYADRTNRQTDGRWTVTLRFPLDAASIIKPNKYDKPKNERSLEPFCTIPDGLTKLLYQYCSLHGSAVQYGAQINLPLTLMGD